MGGPPIRHPLGVGTYPGPHKAFDVPRPLWEFLYKGGAGRGSATTIEPGPHGGMGCAPSFLLSYGGGGRLQAAAFREGRPPPPLRFVTGGGAFLVVLVCGWLCYNAPP